MSDNLDNFIDETFKNLPYHGDLSFICEAGYYKDGTKISEVKTPLQFQNVDWERSTPLAKKAFMELLFYIPPSMINMIKEVKDKCTD